MSLKLPRSSLAVVAPITILVMFTVLASSVYIVERKMALAEVIADQKNRLEQDLFRMSHLLVSALSTQDASQIEREVLLASIDVNMSVYLILDNNSLIRFANHTVWRSSDATKVIDGYRADIHAEVVDSSVAMIVDNPNRLSIQAYYPIKHLDNRTNLDSFSVDLIYAEYDLSGLFHDALTVQFRQFALMWGLGLLCVVVQLLGLFLIFIRPLIQLSRQVNSGSAESLLSDIPWASTEIKALQQTLYDSFLKRDRITKLARDSELRWMFAVDGVHKGIWDWDILTKEVFFSDRWKEILGLSLLEVKSEYSTWESLIHTEDKHSVIKALYSYIDGNINSFDCIYRMRHHQGHYIWVHDIGMLVEWDLQSKPLRMIGSICQLTEDAIPQEAEEA